MPLGFHTTARRSVGDIYAPPADSLAVHLTGVEATGAIGTAVGAAQVQHFATGVEATAQLGPISDLFINGSERTMFIVGFEAVSALGTTLQAARAGYILESGVEGVTGLGSVIAQGTFAAVTGVEATSQLGTTGQIEKQAWMRITPTNDPNWVEITIHAPLS